jgi:hypothetical protein
MQTLALILFSALLGAVAWHNWLLYSALHFPSPGGEQGMSPGRGARGPTGFTTQCKRPRAANPFAPL